MAPHSSTLAWKIPWTEEPGRLQSMGSRRVRHDWATSLSLFTSMHWKRKMATHSSVLAWRIPGTGSHRVGHDWGDLAAAVAIYMFQCSSLYLSQKNLTMLCLHHRSPSNCSHRASFLEEEGNVTADELWSKFSTSAWISIFTFIPTLWEKTNIPILTKRGARPQEVQ